MKRALKYRCLSTILIVVGSYLSAGCAGHIWWPDSLADFRVTSHGQDRGGDFCADFRLEPAQARWFFGRAKVQSVTSQRDRLNQLPCWVRGTARGADGTWRWEIRAGGNARLIAPDGGEQILACSNCRAVLPEWKPRPLPSNNF
jgi:hypothetical protein